MKIAILYYGYLRQFEMIHQLQLQYLGLTDPNHQVDIFIYTSQNNHLKKLINGKHTWDEINANTSDKLSQIVGNSLKDVKFLDDDHDYHTLHHNKIIETQNSLKNCLSLKAIHPINDSRIRGYLNINASQLKLVKNNELRSKSWIFRQTDQFLQFYLCFKLFEQYINKHQINYDLIIKIRPDVLLNVPLNVTSYLNMIQTKKNCLVTQYGVDFFAIGNFHTMKLLATFYQSYGLCQITENIQNKSIFSPETQMTLFMKKNFNIVTIGHTASYLTPNAHLEYHNELNQLCEKIYGLPIHQVSQPFLWQKLISSATKK